LPSKAAVTAESACLENDTSLPIHQADGTDAAQNWVDRRLWSAAIASKEMEISIW
jgi:hypothetical protein